MATRNVPAALGTGGRGRCAVDAQTFLSPPQPPTQIGSCTNQMGQIAIISFQKSTPKVIECFNVESRILCMVFVPTEERPAQPEAAAQGALGVPTVCLGTEEGR